MQKITPLTGDEESQAGSDAERTLLVNAESIPNGNQLRNINCHEYLKYLVDVISFDPKETLPSIVMLRKFKEEDYAFESAKAYGNLYTDFFNQLEKDIEQAVEGRALLLAKIAPLLDAIYANRNQALERAASMVQKVVDSVCHTSEDEVKEKINARLNRTITGCVNRLAPQDADTAMTKARTFFPALFGSMASSMQEGYVKMLAEGGAKMLSYCGYDTRGMHETCMTSVLQYDYRDFILEQREFEEVGEKVPLLFRMGTQAQYVRGVPRVSPIFEAWLETKKPEDDCIIHVYFNKLKRDHSGAEGSVEGKLTEKLEDLENRHTHLAVITLPAHGGLMEVGTEESKCNDAFNKILAVANNTSQEKIKDFYISPRIKEKLYLGSAENAELKKLLNNSFGKILGATDPENATHNISPAEFQAVYFHFINYELTDFILKKLKPNSCNKSCKDGIDRANIASLYYHLIKSIEEGKPLSRKEFERALHAAATLVKGRGLNFHSKLLWSAIDHHIEGNAKQSEKNKKKIPPWLVEWRNKHALKESKPYLINQLTAEINRLGTGSLVMVSPAVGKSLVLFSGKKDPGILTEEEIKSAVNAAAQLKLFLTDGTAPSFTRAELDSLAKGDLAVLNRKIEEKFHMDFTTCLLPEASLTT